MATDSAGAEDKISEGFFVVSSDERWRAMDFKEKEVLEFEAVVEDEGEKVKCQAAMIMSRGEVTEHGDLLIYGRYIAADKDEVAKVMSNLINRRGWPVHLCGQDPCEAQLLEVGAHVSRARWFKPENFGATYLKPWGSQLLKAAIGREELPEDPPEGERREPSKRQGPKRDPERVKRPVPRRERKKRDTEPEEKEPAREADKGGEAASTRRALQTKLSALKGRLLQQKSESAGEVVDLVGQEDSSGRSGESDCAEDLRQLVAGTNLNPWESRLALPSGGLPEGPRGSTMRKSLKVKKEEKRGMRKKRKRSSMLLAAAEQREGQLQEKKKKKKGKGGSQSSAAKALVKLLQPKSSRKKRLGRGSDPSGDGSSDEESSEEEEDSSESEVMAPLKKRAHRRPGSILKMLVGHAKDAMDQTSVVGVPDNVPITQGIKMSSYFNLLVRPYFSASSRDMKEMHLLAITLDLLRSGQLKELGDALSARFLALHCAASEGTWAAARHLELYPLESTQSAPTEVLLQARKHARVIQKSQGIEDSSWKRRSGGDSSGWKGGDYQEVRTGKGKGGKGKDGKGKGKGKGGGWNQHQEWNNWNYNKSNWWKEQKENKDGKENKGDKDTKK